MTSPEAGPEPGRGRFSEELLRLVEAEVDGVPFRGLAVGATLDCFLHVDCLCGQGDWSAKGTWKARLRAAYHARRPIRGSGGEPFRFAGKVLATWLSDNYRWRDLSLPVVRALGPDECALVCQSAGLTKHVPAGVHAQTTRQSLTYDAQAWERDFDTAWPEWERRLEQVSERFGLPGGFVVRARDELLVRTQMIAGFQGFLEQARPSAVLVEHDRNPSWSCLVLAARTCGIPTFALVHGVVGERASGYFPFLADFVFCWGAIDRLRFADAGADATRLLDGGCPRLTRHLAASREASLRKLGLDPDRPVVLLGTDPLPADEAERLVDVFCRAASHLHVVHALVRLHPSESRETYAALGERFPHVHFLDNRALALDEALAAADVVVVHGSGLGSDALVKRRLAVVLDVLDLPVGHGEDLVRRGGCPRARSVEELTEVLRKLLFDPDARIRHALAAEEFVRDFCVAFGEDAAGRIAAQVLGRRRARRGGGGEP